VPFSRNSFGRQPFPPGSGMRGPGSSPFGMMGQPRPRPMQGNFQRGTPQKPGGGLLSKILNRGNAAQSAPSQFNPLQGAAGFQRSSSQAGGSFLKNLMNPGSINGFLNNTQNVLKSAQQMGPMIQQFQQYGPLVKNLPAMWKLYRGLSAADTEEEESIDSPVDDVEEEIQPEAKSATKKTKKRRSTSSPDKSQKKQTQSSGSKPKLYV
jgi:hypothetical protein